MKTKTLIKSSILFFLALGLIVLPKAVEAQSNPHYNVLFIAVDDMNDRISFLGNSEVVSPNLQRLVARGMIFKRAYCQYPLCSPSRTSFLSGWRPDKTQILSNTTRPRSVMGPNIKFLPEYFKQYGYHIERYGKIMHGRFENDIAWDYAEPSERASSDVQTNLYDYYQGDDWWIHDVADKSLPDGIWVSHLITRMQQPQSQLFFYGLGLTVHHPFTPSLKYWNMNGDPSVQELLPIDADGTTTDLKGNGSEPILIPATPESDRNDVPSIAFTGQELMDDAELKRATHAYDAEVAHMDALLGLVLDEMDRQNLWTNTIVIFLGDHGQHLGEHEGLWGKGTLFEESHHVPLIVCVPGKPAGKCSKLVELVDLYPTLTELCQLTAPPGMEGFSFAPLLDNPNLPWKRAAFCQVLRSKGRSVCTERYRYNSWGTNGEELYDHNDDPHEYTNLAGNPQYATVLNGMRRILAEGWTKSIPPPQCANPQTFYLDSDGDGYGNASISVQACSMPAGFSENKTDCNDNNANVHPGAVEVCGNNIDDDCDGQVDEGCTCKNATSLTTTNITSTSAKLNWVASANPTQWQIQYRKAITGTPWTNIFRAGSMRSVTISSLTPNQKYSWHIRAKCGTTWTTYSALRSFTTLSTLQAASFENVTIEKSSTLRLYPNPTNNQFVIDLNIAEKINTNAKIELANMMGQTVSTENGSISNGKLQRTVSMPSSLSKGIYMVKVIVNDKVYMAKLIYEK
jgi:iduronate 2-sulfatase